MEIEDLNLHDFDTVNRDTGNISHQISEQIKMQPNATYMQPAKKSKIFILYLQLGIENLR
jgi:hypothetical protein